MRSSKASPPTRLPLPQPTLDLQKKVKDKKERVTNTQKITKKHINLHAHIWLEKKRS
jgi:hypothetical protein